jgi:hypothetical protein
MHATTNCLVGAFALSVTACAGAGPENPIELGRVTWSRDLGAALRESSASGRPVFLQFQEIPGCATCRTFGAAVLSHPLLVDAIETEFVPVAIHNNRPGPDAEVLARFQEPAWNNPVVRFLDGGGRDLVSRRDGVWLAGGMAQRMIEALEAARRPVPEYLRLVAAELAAPEAARVASVTFTMHCFWEGEIKLGALDGVLNTRAAWMEGAEAVEVTYDPQRIDLKALTGHAMSAQCARRVYLVGDGLEEARAVAGKLAQPAAAAAADAPPSDRRHALRASSLRFLPLTPLQATKVNSDLGLGRDPARWLSPRQRELAARVEAALSRQADALAGLERPEHLDHLAEYEGRLRARLARAAAEA